METYLILGIGLIVIIIFLLHEENWKGCIMYALAIMFGLIFYYCAEHFKKPSYESRVEVVSPYGTVVRFSNSCYLCPSGGTSYCVEKSDRKEPSRMDTCINCGKMFWKHNYESNPVEKQKAAESVDEYMNAVIETPAE